MNGEVAVVLVLALLLDRAVGEPSNPYHPVAYLGRGISGMAARIGDRKLGGVALYLAAVIPFTAAAYYLASMEGLIGIALAGVFLKLQFSWRGLGDHARPVADYLSQGDMAKAREAVSRIVGRDTSSLEDREIASAAVESIGDSTVDGIISPIFYYAAFGLFMGVPEGVAAAAFYRATNTLDSMVGYRRKGLSRLGFFSAKMDDALNYFPARICGGLLIVSAVLKGEAWKNSAWIYLRERDKTPSPNAGHPISAVAGALGVRLEKAGVYTIGEEREHLGSEHIFRALALSNLTVVLFTLAMLVALWRL